jgi:periplasmic divalent cation tolerance protein
MLLFKTRCQAYAKLEKLLKDEHPYELPEVVAVPINHGSPGYLQWIEQNTPE